MPNKWNRQTTPKKSVEASYGKHWVTINGAHVLIEGSETITPADTMVDVIALSSPSGNMSNRSRKAAQERIRKELFPTGYWDKQGPTNEQKASQMLRTAAELRRLADLGMRPRAHRKEADRLEKEAKQLMDNP
jgi:hypothetical protein